MELTFDLGFDSFTKAIHASTTKYRFSTKYTIKNAALTQALASKKVSFDVEKRWILILYAVTTAVRAITATPKSVKIAWVV